MKTASHRALLPLALALALAASACGGGGGGGPNLSVLPTSLSLQAGGGPAGVTATLTGAPGPVTWSLSPGLGTLSATTGASVLYTPPAALSSSISEVLTAAAAGQTARVTIGVSPRAAAPPSLAIFPSSAGVAAGGSPITFGTALANATGTVSWTLNPPGVGTLSATTGPSVTWTPPASVVQAVSATITASVAGMSSRAVLAVVPGGPVSLPSWTYHPPSDWTSGTLALPVPAGQSAMVLLLNTDPGAVDGAGASLSVSGTTALASALATATSPLSASGGAAAVNTGADVALRGSEAALAPLVAAAKGTGALGRLSQALTVPANPGSFCVAYGAPGPGASFTRISATLAWESAHALFYVDPADASQFQAADWQALANVWESQIYPSDTGIFGPPSDVDGNGKLIVLFTDKLGSAINGGVMAGYFWAGDLFGPDTSPGCDCGTANAPACTATGSLAFPYRGSNGADMFVMNTPDNLATASYTLTNALTQVIPSTLAHEFQHLINFNLHCLLPPNDCVVEETWLNEAMSKVAEDEAGFGWHSSVAAAKMYLMLAPSSGTHTYTSYDTASLTAWPAGGGDPVGNYEGVHSFLRYHADQRGTALLTALSGDPSTGNLLTGKANLAWALGATFESAMADFATAVAFSNEAFVPDPRFDYTGAAWTPFHTALRYLQYVDLNPGATATASVRQDGWSAFATGAAGTNGATIVVQSSAAVKPAVLLVTFTGTLLAN